ncbi:MAG: hypothetical protein ACI39W_06870 [Brotaphodocola sp.]
MKKVIKVILCFTAAMMVFSLAACTPTTEKNKTGEVKQTAAANGIADKNPDPTAPVLDIVSIYTVSDDGSKLEGTMDAVDELNENTLTDMLIEYGVLAEGTRVNSFSAEGEPSSQAVGPGVVAIPGETPKNNTKEYGVVDFNQFPDVKDNMLLQAVANTFIENMDVVYMTISVEGEVVAENLTMMNAGK